MTKFGFSLPRVTRVGPWRCSFCAWYQLFGNERIADDAHDTHSGTYLGPAYGEKEIRDFPGRARYPYEYLENGNVPSRLQISSPKEKSSAGSRGEWNSARARWGARSIIGDARNPKMQSQMNLKIKYRESFRPFAPSVLMEEVNNFFELDRPSPYMLLVANVDEKIRRSMTDDEHKLWGIDKLNVARSEIPAITHVDYSARIQNGA